MRSLTPEQTDAAIAAVQAAFRKVRPLIVPYAGKVAYTDKQDGTPFTETDAQVENAIFAELNRQFPDMPVFGEETGYRDDQTGAFWLIDPIDGTKSFIQNIPAYTSMAVLIQDGEAVASVIYNTFEDDMYTAQKGKGAYKNGKLLHLSKVPLPKIAFCKETFIQLANDILQTKGVACETAPTGAGYGFSLVAEGRIAARFNLPGLGHIHDYAPGALLVREAGGAIVPIQDDTYTYKTRSFVACHPEIEPAIRQHKQELRNLEQQAPYQN